MSPVEILEQMVALETVSGRSTEQFIALVGELLAGKGTRIHTHAPYGDGRANLVAYIGPTGDDSRSGLALSGHMDVVPAGGGWTTPPFRLTRRDGHLHARGAADMKGFLATAVAVLQEIDPESLRHPVALLLTFDEEVGTVGARELALGWVPPEPLPRECLIGEPTNLVPVTAHKGHLKLRIEVAGVSAHSGYPHLGRSAIEPVGPLLVALSRLRERLESERTDASARFPEVPYPALNVGTIRGGSAVNVVPDRCTLDVGVRLLPGMDGDAMAERVRAVAEETLGTTPHSFENLGVSPPMVTPERSRLAEALGLDAPDSGGAVAYATDAGWLQTMDMACVIWGPGSIEVAHKPDEFVPERELDGARVGLNTLIERFCA